MAARTSQLPGPGCHVRADTGTGGTHPGPTQARGQPRDSGRFYSHNRVVSRHLAKEIKEVVMTARERPICDCPEHLINDN